MPRASRYFHQHQRYSPCQHCACVRQFFLRWVEVRGCLPPESDLLGRPRLASLDEESSRLLQRRTYWALMSRGTVSKCKLDLPLVRSVRRWAEVEAWFKARGHGYPVECQLCLADLRRGGGVALPWHQAPCHLPHSKACRQRMYVWPA